MEGTPELLVAAIAAALGPHPAQAGPLARVPGATSPSASADGEPEARFDAIFGGGLAITGNSSPPGGIPLPVVAARPLVPTTAGNFPGTTLAKVAGGKEPATLPSDAVVRAPLIPSQRGLPLELPDPAVSVNARSAGEGRQREEPVVPRAPGPPTARDIATRPEVLIPPATTPVPERPRTEPTPGRGRTVPAFEPPAPGRERAPTVQALGLPEPTQSNERSVGQVAPAASETSPAAPSARAESLGPSPLVLGTAPSHQAAQSSTAVTVSEMAMASPDAMAEDIADHLVRLVERNGNAIRVQLNPPELGSIEVRVQLNDDRASVWFQAAQAGARDALEQALPRLKSLLESAGMQLGDTGVAGGGRQGEQRAAMGEGYDALPQWTQSATPVADTPDEPASEGIDLYV